MTPDGPLERHRGRRWSAGITYNRSHDHWNLTNEGLLLTTRKLGDSIRTHINRIETLNSETCEHNTHVHVHMYVRGEILHAYK